MSTPKTPMERAEAYATSMGPRLDSHGHPTQRWAAHKRAHLAGATEEAAIKDAEIERLNMSVLGLKSSGNAEKITALESLRQQLTATQEELQEAREVIAVYADKENWHCRVEDSYSGLINEWTAQGIDTDSDEDIVNGEWQGGKRARVFLSKYPRETTSAQDAR